MIEKVYYINLDRSANRRKHMERMLRNAGIEAERFPAIDGTSINIEKMKQNGELSADIKLRKASVGCALSHISLWRKIKDGNYNSAMIFEDDVIIPDDFWKVYERRMKFIPKKWDILYFGGSALKGTPINQHALKPIAQRAFNGGFFAYMINAASAEKFLKYLEEKPLNNMIDLYIRDHLNELNAFIPYPIVIQHDFGIKSVRYSKDEYSDKYLERVQNVYVIDKKEYAKIINKNK